MPRAAAQQTPAAAPVSNSAKKRRPARAEIDLQRYAPAYFSWIATKLSGGASQAYLAAFDIGIETWRLLVLLAIEPSVSAHRVCKVIGMDKASVSRTFKSMQRRGLITINLDPNDGRVRVASITSAGLDLHDRMRGIALERERALMSVLSPEERKQLLSLLRRLHDNLPSVEAATMRYLELHYPHAARQRRKTLTEG